MPATVMMLVLTQHRIHLMRRFVHPPRLIVLHHAAALSETADAYADAYNAVFEWHLARGFSTIGYHAFAHGNQYGLTARPYDFQGAHCRGRNSSTLGICVYADLTREPLTSDMVSSVGRAVQALRSLSRRWLPVVGHSDLAPTFCPGPDLVQSVTDWLADRDT